MQIYHDNIEAVSPVPRGVALGFFDGVHQGHLELIRTLLFYSRSRQLRASVFTFPNHPQLHVGKEDAFDGYLCDLDERLDELARCGVSELHLQTFNKAFALLEPEQFLQTYLIDRLHARLIVAGSDYRFGRDGSGDVAMLQQWAEKHDIEVMIVPDVRLYGEKVSSSRIRDAVQSGDLKLADRLLGRPYRMRGEVVSGKGLGQKIGFPTANIHVADDRVCPSYGVYATRTTVDGKTYDSITNVGLRPTVKEESKKPLIETYLYDANINLYGKSITVAFLRKMRDEKQFRSILMLTSQIDQDLKKVSLWHQQSEIICQRAVVHDIPLYWLPTSRFAQSMFTLVCRSPMDRRMTTALLLLIRILTASSRRYPTRPALAEALDSCYGAQIHAALEKQGDMQAIVFNAAALHHWTDGSSPFAETIEIFFDLLFDPLVDEQGQFDNAIVESERTNIIMEWQSRENDRLKFAYDRCMQALSGDQLHGLSALGDRDLIHEISHADLQAAYQYLLNDMQIACYVGGRPDPQLLQQCADRLAGFSDKKRPNFYPGHAPALFKPEQPGQMVERKDLAQARIVLAWYGLPPYFSARSITATVLNSMLGGDVHSLLFDIVREKLGLAYQVFSMNQRYHAMLLMLAGVAPDQVDQARAAMKEQLTLLASGEFSEQLLLRTRRMIKASILSIRDDLANMMSHQLSSLTHGRIFSVEDMLDMLYAVTREEVADLAASLVLKADYVLTSLDRSASPAKPIEEERI